MLPFRKNKPLKPKNRRFSFQFEINPKIFAHLTINWEQKWQVSWFIFNNQESDYINPNSIIIESQLFLLIKNNQEKHFLLFKNVLMLVKTDMIIIKICNQINRLRDQKHGLNREQKRTLAFAKKQLRIIKRNEVYSLLPHEIFQKYQAIEIIKFLKFLHQYKITIDK